MRVLVTRARSDAARTAAELEAAGHEPVLAPVVEIVSTGEFPSGQAFDAMVATSAHAFVARGTVPDAWRRKPLFAVGDHTAEAADAAGFTGVRSCRTDAAGLSTLITTRVRPPARLLYLAGRDRKPTLEAALSAAGYSLSVHETYEARRIETWPDPALDDLRADRIDAALHFSRRSAALALGLARHHGVAAAFLRVRHLCLSADVAAPLVSAGAERIEVAARPEAASLLALVAAAPASPP